MSIPSNTSPSYLQFFSNTNAFLQSAYSQLLHRSADADGFSFWTTQINNGATYVSVINSFINGKEYNSNISNQNEFITSLYQNLLHRIPDQGGLNFWLQQLAHGSTTSVIDSFLQSKEFQSSAASQNIPSSSLPLLFSSEGGGLRAMTTDAGLIAGLIKYYENTRGTKIDLSNLLSQIDAVSSNSGSSWFVSALAYSAPFEDSLQNYSQLFDPNTGFMGLMGQAYIKYLHPFSSVGANGTNEANWSRVEDLLIHIPNLNWANFLNETIYAPFKTADLLKATNLYSSLDQRTDALSNQALIFQAAISTDKAAISPYAVIGEMVGSVKNNASDTSGIAYQFIPTALTSKSNFSNQTALFLPTVPSSGLILEYTDLLNEFQTNPPSITTAAPNLNFNGLSVFTASAASSAALAFENSLGASGGSVAKLKLMQEVATPVLINLVGATSVGTDYPNAAGKNYPDVGNISLKDIISSPVIRLGDGHYADGTSVTAGMSYFTADQLKDGFNVTLFGNMAFSDYTKNPSMPDASFLSILGIGQDPTSSLSTNLYHPSNKVFDLVGVTDPMNWRPTPTWSYSLPGGDISIKYYEIAVKTSVGNPYAAAGNLGTVRLWEVASDAGMITKPTDAGWSEYSTLYNDIITGLQKSNNGHIGADLLAHSFGLI
jgi:hypothetical protein